MPLNDCDPITTGEVTDISLTVGSMTITGSTITQGNILLPALKATWTASANPYVAGVQFEYVPSDASSGPTRTGVQGNATASWAATETLIAGKNYDVRWRAVGTAPNTYGSWAAPVTRTPSSIGPTLNRYYTDATDPAALYTVVDGDQWFDPVVSALKFRVSGSWVIVATIATPLPDGTVLFDSSAGGAFSFPIPSNALTHVDIYVFGGGGGAGWAHGGGGSGYSKYLNYAVTAGTTVIAGTIGAAGRGEDSGGFPIATAGGNSTITTPAMAANGGGHGRTAAGTAGTASGGTTNTAGEAGDTGGAGNGGANLGAGTYTGGARKTTGTPSATGNAPGGGGYATDAGGNGGAGAPGRVVIVTRT